jgi:hypothetical protein
MKKHTASPDELDLFELTEAAHELDQRRRALEDSKRKAEAERRDRENTLPPSDVVSAKQKQKHHDEVVFYTASTPNRPLLFSTYSNSGSTDEPSHSLQSNHRTRCPTAIQKPSHRKSPLNTAESPSSTPTAAGCLKKDE